VAARSMPWTRHTLQQCRLCTVAESADASRTRHQRLGRRCDKQPAKGSAVTPDSGWWDRAKLPPRPQPIEIRTRERLCTVRKGQHQITLEKRDVPTMGEELILSVNSEWR
jgi:hypothetical protein